MEKKRLLLVTQELDPYTGLSEISSIVANLPKPFQSGGYEVRILMPRFGTINERRHRLHEVVRLSGMNIIVDDDDYPLIIKVASLPGFRLQVYFLDNDDFFKRKSVFEDSKGVPFEDNPDRAAFFCKGVIETVKKFGWPPDVILCHGWMTSLLPFYIRTAYKTEPLFENSNIVYNVYDTPHATNAEERFFQKVAINNLETSELEVFRTEDGYSMHKGACHYADAIVIGSENLDTSVDYLSPVGEKPIQPYVPEDQFGKACVDFCDELIEAREEVL